jgi:hypothetical protein
MGREIVYCWKCAKRVEGADFESRKAYRYGDKVSCDECVFDLVGDLPAEELEAILKGTAPAKPGARVRPSDTTRRGTGPVPKVSSGSTGRTTAVRMNATGKVGRATGKVPTVDAAGGTRSIPKRGTRVMPKVEEPLADAPPEEGVDEAAAAKKKKLILIGAGGGGLLLVVVVVLLVILMGGKKKPVAAPVVEETVKTDVKRPDPKVAREEAAKKAFDAAMGVFRDKPDDLGAKLRAMREAEAVSSGTSVDDAVKTQIDQLLLIELPKQLSSIDAELLPLTRDDKFKTALELVEKAAARVDAPEWKEGIDKKSKYVKDKLEERFGQEKKAATAAKDDGETAKVDAVVAKVAAWGLPDYVERLKKELGPTAAAAPDASANPDATPKPGTPAAKKPRREAKPLSKEMQAYQSGFERALGLAFQRDFDGAANELRKTAKEIDSDEVRKEAGADAEILDQAKAWVEGAIKKMASTKRLDALSLEYHDRPAEFKTVTGRPTKVFDQRFEFRTAAEKDKKASTLFIEYADLTGRTLAEMSRKIDGKLDSPKLAAAICLIEGQEEGAVALGGKDAESLPDRWWLHAAVALEKAPKSNGKEFEARALFHQAELEYADFKTRGTALEKYKTLSNEYATARIVQRNQALISKRGEVGKEYVFNARSLVTEGAFKPAKKPDLVVQGTKDVDVQEMKDNFVEANFYALAGTTYRAWALLGGCCKETFGCYLQTSEATTANAGKQVPIDPGGNMAAQVKIQASGLKPDHAAHAPKDKKAPHPKDAARWEWVVIPLPKTYQTAGAKGIRLLTDQAGFAVKFIVVSSVRTKTPDDKDASEWLRQLNEEPASDDSGVKGTPEAKEWLLAGPFDEALNKVNVPEKEIDLAKELTGKGNKKFKWKLVPNTPQGGYSVFSWEDGKTFSPKDGVSGYALIHVKAPSPMEVHLSVGHDDGARIWVNGEVVHQNDRNGGVKNDEFKPKAHLEDGWNRILVKVRSKDGGFGFSFRILDDKGQPAQGLEYSAYGDQLVPP